MTVSRRTRFEILRRDNHACRYCGGVAPDVQLHVDHVIPVALGGSDDPSNLVTACKDCNSGKASTSPTETLVGDVSDKALALAEAFRAELAKEVQDIQAEENYREEFRATWNAWGVKGIPLELPSSWRETLGQWRKIGVPMEIINRAIDTAMVKKGIRGADGEFRYMCGIVWRTLDAAQQRAVGATTEQPSVGEEFRIVTCQNEGCEIPAIRYAEDGEGYCSYCEFTNGWQGGSMDEAHRAHMRGLTTDFVALHIDQMESQLSKTLRWAVPDGS